MSRRIAKLLGEPENEVTKLLSELENKNGFPRHDVRHISQVHQRIREKISDLNLDPDDTTAQELYHTLQTRFENDSEQLDDFYDAASKNFDERLSLAAQLVNKTMNPPELWALKKSASKEMLRQNAPKRVMKAAGFRSIESMLKREDIRTISLAAEILESDSWHKAQARLISKLDPSAFELRSISAIALSSDWLDDARPKRLIISSDTQGVISIPSCDLTKDLPLLSIILLLADKFQTYGADIHAICKIYETLGWWSDTRHLIASLGGDAVSMNLKDVSSSWLYGHEFNKRQLDGGRQSYWRDLVERYQNREEFEDAFDRTVMQRVRQLKVKAPEPAFEFEYAEELEDI